MLFPIMKISEVYTQYFSPNAADPRNWESLNSTAEELRYGPNEPDFSIDNRTCCSTCKKIALLLLKIILVPWILYEAITFVAQRIAMAALYPAQSFFVKCCRPSLRTSHLDRRREELPERFAEQGYVIRHVKLEKDGTDYSGLWMGSPETLDNGKWVLHATGNVQPIERAVDLVDSFQSIGYNLLMVNGPGVGRSDGIATAATLGEPQDIGISFLEHAIKANRLVLSGFSLGGAALGEAIHNHDFHLEGDEHKHYLVIRSMCFDSVGNVGRKKTSKGCFAPFSKCVANWTKLEADNVASSRKLLELQIPEVIIQAGEGDTFAHDGMIPEKATLGRRLQKEGITDPELKQFINVPGARHHVPIETILDVIRTWDDTFEEAHDLRA
jgi:alpha-beta hydrolase superfamily lysophospholipase